MAKLAARGGQRRLGCGLCQTEWVYARTGCLFCGESRPDNLPQFHLDGDRARRVDACRTCRNYLKTVDERELRRPAQLLVEDIVTAHLDILAQQQGYQ
jgi:FdhE protein